MSSTSTFATVINFGMLGLLHSLHRLHTQFCLEAESGEVVVNYPRVEYIASINSITHSLLMKTFPWL